MKHSRGFTLIELMVVISIVAMLSSVVMASVASARVRGRDAARMQQVHQMDLAVQLYIADHGKAPLADWGGYNDDISGCSAANEVDSFTVYNCIAKSNPLQTEDLAMFAAWEQFQSELEPYMPGLAPEACGDSCAGNAGYIYVAPAAAKYRCGFKGLECEVNEDSYQSFVWLERDPSVIVGTSNVQGLDEFYYGN